MDASKKKREILKRLYEAIRYHDKEYDIDSFKSKIIEETREYMKGKIAAKKKRSKEIKTDIKHELSNIKEKVLEMLRD